MTCYRNFLSLEKTFQSPLFPVGFAKFFRKAICQLTFTCSRSTIETLKQDVKYVQSLQ